MCFWTKCDTHVIRLPVSCKPPIAIFLWTHHDTCNTTVQRKNQDYATRLINLYSVFMKPVKIWMFEASYPKNGFTSGTGSLTKRWAKIIQVSECKGHLDCRLGRGWKFQRNKMPTKQSPVLNPNLWHQFQAPPLEACFAPARQYQAQRMDGLVLS
jgi:hypothetical protein